jgi:hypothetical protein
MNNEKNQAEDNVSSGTPNDKMEVTPAATSPSTDMSSLKGLELLRKALQVLGCTLEKDENNEDYYSTMFQGEYFMIRASEDDWEAMAYDIRWLTVPLDDLDTLADVRRAVNDCNTNGINATLCYTIDQDEEAHEQVMAVHTKLSILLIGTIPDYPSYLRARLEASFQQRRVFHSEMNDLRKERVLQK